MGLGHGEEGSGLEGLSATLPPAWVDFSEEVSADINRIKNKLKELAAAEKQRSQRRSVQAVEVAIDRAATEEAANRDSSSLAAAAFSAFAPRPLRLQRERGPAVWQRPRPGGGRAALSEAERRPGGGFGPSGGHRLAEGGDASNTLAAPLEGAGARLPSGTTPTAWPARWSTG